MFNDINSSILAFFGTDESWRITESEFKRSSDGYTLDDSGHFVIAWRDDRDGTNVYSQRYDSDGTPIGNNFLVNDKTNVTGHLRPSIAMDHQGDFIITWQYFRYDVCAIWSQRYHKNGNRIGGNITVNQVTGSRLYYDPAVALHNGKFVTSWWENRIPGQGYDIFANMIKFGIDTVAVPSITPAAGIYTTPQTVILSCSTPGASIHYTLDTSEPTEFSPVYSTPVEISKTTTVQAMAVKPDWVPSEIVTAVFTITGTLATPVFAPVPGLYTTPQIVTLSCSTPGASIHYTLDNTEPTESSPLYSSPFSITQTTTIQARAFKQDWITSEISVATYIITGRVAMPVFDPLPGRYPAPQSVTISCVTPDAIIHYTLDGSEPTQVNEVYSAPLERSITTTIKARAYKTDWDSSEVAMATYEMFISGINNDGIPQLPKELALHQNYPNPFNPSTFINYQLPKNSKVLLVIYNSQGQHIRTLVDERQPAGNYEICWDGTDNHGQRISSGLYLVRLIVGGKILVIKVLLMK